MATEEIIDEHVSVAQCKKAVSALLSHSAKIVKQKEEKELIPGKEENVWLVLSIKNTIPEKKLKPYQIPVAHPIVDPRTSSVCLITKDPQREYKDLLEENNIKFISRVVGVTKLKGKFKPFEARRMLAKENGLFLADERVVPLLPGLLGKIFFDAKKQPIPVSLRKKDLKAELEKAISSTYMHQNQGSCTSIKIGTIAQSAVHIVDNLRTALPVIAKRINGGWDNIQSLHIKTNTSLSLPIWSCKLGEEGRWKETRKAEVTEGWSGFDEKGQGQADEHEELEPEAPTQKQSAPSKGKKRAAQEEDKPQSKKSKVKEVSEDPSPEGRTKSSLKAKQSTQEDVPPARKPRLKKDEDHAPERSAKKSKKGTPDVPLAESHAADKADAPQSTKGHTHAELKKKRVDEKVEKRKDKVLKAKGAGSVKETVLGKKAKSRI